MCCGSNDDRSLPKRLLEFCLWTGFFDRGYSFLTLLVETCSAWDCVWRFWKREKIPTNYSFFPFQLQFRCEGLVVFLVQHPAVVERMLWIGPDDLGPFPSPQLGCSLPASTTLELIIPVWLCCFEIIYIKLLIHRKCVVMAGTYVDIQCNRWQMEIVQWQGESNKDIWTVINGSRNGANCFSALSVVVIRWGRCALIYKCALHILCLRTDVLLFMVSFSLWLEISLTVTHREPCLLTLGRKRLYKEVIYLPIWVFFLFFFCLLSTSPILPFLLLFFCLHPSGSKTGSKGRSPLSWGAWLPTVVLGAGTDSRGWAVRAQGSQTDCQSGVCEPQGGRVGSSCYQGLLPVRSPSSPFVGSGAQDAVGPLFLPFLHSHSPFVVFIVPQPYTH